MKQGTVHVTGEQA